MDYLSPHPILTRKYASNHRLRSVVPTTQLCDGVGKCMLEIWFQKSPKCFANDRTNDAFEECMPGRLISIVGKNYDIFVSAYRRNAAKCGYDYLSLSTRRKNVRVRLKHENGCIWQYSCSSWLQYWPAVLLSEYLMTVVYLEIRGHYLMTRCLKKIMDLSFHCHQSAHN